MFQTIENMKVMTEIENIKKMVERFLDGETTTAEEQMLYDFFAADVVPKELRPYQEMFRWYAGGMKEPLPDGNKKRTLLARIAVAASVVLLVGVGVGWYRHVEYEKLCAIYKDSYIVRNGKKITDIRTIKPELERVSNEVALSLSRDFSEKQINIQDLPVI